MNFRFNYEEACRVTLAAAIASLLLFAESALSGEVNIFQSDSESSAFVDSVSKAISDLDGVAGVHVNKGESTVNGSTFPMQAISAELDSESFAQKLRLALGKSALVATHHTNLSDVIVITPTAVVDKMESIKQAYVISVMNLPDGARLSMGSSAGALMSATLGKPVMTSPWLNRSLKTLKPSISSGYRFAATNSIQELATCENSIFQCRMNLAADLRAVGFIPVNPDERVDSESNGVLANADTEYTGVWQKGRTTVYLNINKKSNDTHSEVGIYEVTTK